ncbi:hypothetical protein [Pseudochryseolinea flava]|nr:hypothetical protein [Pseudochryseolinea flava]
MKNLLMMLFVFMTAMNVSAQSSKNEFVFQAKSSRAELNRGGSSNLDLSIARSKKYEHSEMKLTVGSGLPAGVVVSFNPTMGDVNSATAAIVVSEGATPGTYNLVLNCTINNRTKGIIVKLIVLE